MFVVQNVCIQPRHAHTTLQLSCDLHWVLAGKPVNLDEQFNGFNYWRVDHGLILEDPEPAAAPSSTSGVKGSGNSGSLKSASTPGVAGGSTSTPKK